MPSWLSVGISKSGLLTAYTSHHSTALMKFNEGWGRAGGAVKSLGVKCRTFLARGMILSVHFLYEHKI
jgi:hypothetical protein